MGEVQRLHKSRGRAEAHPASAEQESAHSPAKSPAGPSWASAAPAAPFALGGVQRKVAIGASNDAYEREADSVASRVAGGQKVSPGAISSISPASLNPVGQRQAKSEEKKKDEKPAAAPVQREVKPEDKTKDAKSAMPVQREAKPPEKKKDEKAAAAPVQRADKPDDKKKDEKAAAPPVQRAAKPDEKKKDEKPVSAPVQRESKPDEKKKDEKPAPPPVQRAAKPDEKKKDDKAAAPVQRNVRPEDKKKLERDSSAPVQMQSKPEEKKKDDKAAAPVQRAAKPDEKKKEEKPAAAPVQRESKPDDKKKDGKAPASPVQRAAKPEEKKKDDKSAAPVQRESKPDDKKKDEKPAAAPVQRMEGEKDPHKSSDHAVQTSRSDAAAPSAPSMESAASNAIATKGPGEPINSSTRNTLESGLGSDLSDVRVHNDTAAHSAAEALNARAFTHQNDIWLGRGESQHNVPLMAHEATHVVQQTGSVHRQLVQRAGEPAAKPGDKKSSESTQPPEPAKLEGDTVVIPSLRLPSYDRKANSVNFPLTLKKGKRERPNDQRAVWAKDIVGDASFKANVKARVKDQPKVPSDKTNKDIYFLKPLVDDKYIIGDEDVLPAKLTTPTWDKDGKYHPYHVDHIQEIQLDGENLPKNMELLDAHANTSSGASINADLQKKGSAAAAQLGKEGKIPANLKSYSDLKTNYNIRFENKDASYSVVGDPKNFWDRESVKAGAHLKPLKALTPKEIEAKGLRGGPTKLVLYPRTGKPLFVNKWDQSKTSYDIPNFWPQFDLKTVQYTPGSGGLISGILLPRRIPLAPQKAGWKIMEEPGVDYGGTLGINLDALTLAGLSPITIEDAGLDSARGIVAKGILRPSIKPFEDLEIDLLIEGGDLTLSKTFSAGELSFPGPVHVTGSSLTISAGTAGIAASGEVLFEIDRVGKGKISGEASTKEGPSISGSFDFDTTLFDPARIEVKYAKGKFSGSGTLGIPKGKVRGIKSASITASFDDDKIDAKGSVLPDIPAVEQADLTLHYSKEDGLVIAGDVQLKKDIPGIEGGSLHAQVAKKPGSDRYIVSASGEATPKIPGINSKLIVTYDDGAFDATVTAGYEKGMLKGSVTVGATNRPVGDDGKPGPPPKEQSTKIIVYGGGSVTLKLAPWLQATAAIKFKPNGEVEVTGQIGLPSTLDIFDEKKVDKNLFKIGIDIPIIGFSVLGQHVGIFLNIGGGLDLSAGIGPGQLQDVNLSVTYNPAHEEDTQVHGHAALHIPAHAGIRLFVRAALGAGIPIVDAEAGLELGGSLGIEGAAHADVDVDWTPKKGLVLDASASVYAEPKFKFDITGFVLVEADLLFKTITLYEHKWKLKEFEYGSGLRLGLKMPIHYEEGKPFNVSLSDIQFEVPQIDAMDTLKGLFDKII